MGAGSARLQARPARGEVRFGAGDRAVGGPGKGGRRPGRSGEPGEPHLPRTRRSPADRVRPLPGPDRDGYPGRAAGHPQVQGFPLRPVGAPPGGNLGGPQGGPRPSGRRGGLAPGEGGAGWVRGRPAPPVRGLRVGLPRGGQGPAVPRLVAGRCGDPPSDLPHPVARCPGPPFATTHVAPQPNPRENGRNCGERTRRRDSCPSAPTNPIVGAGTASTGSWPAGGHRPDGPCSPGEGARDGTG
jgi:hypothetical protein